MAKGYYFVIDILNKELEEQFGANLDDERIKEGLI
jgi:hypothetical protein